ncbi:MAG: fimbrial protein FimV [Rhodoferax sp.]|nr:FimV/HubP family polar landmark protein [Rhodoferax sp.]MDD2924147.1 fimbrial protein FimV [Rhodoferax sp.]
MGLWGTEATALSLGRITVQSALGEPLKAEIDVLDINAEEAASLQVKVAAPEVFRTAGLEYNPAMGNLQATLQRRAGGRAYIMISSDRVISEPFVDMILETSWGTGRIVRDYTMLFDPPNLRVTQPTPPVSAQTTTQTVAAPVAQAKVPEPTVPAVQPSSVRPPAPTPAPEPVKPVPVAKAPPPVAVVKTAEPRSQSGAATVTVKAGDTAGRLAAANKPANVSLDQMLVALLRANPDAFIHDNVNRIKAGAILSLPTEQQANETAPEQARQIIVAQSQDFNKFRREFADNAPMATVTPAKREVRGKVEASVVDKAPVAPTPDKLTLSKGAIQGKTAEDQVAQARSKQEASSRSAELAKNISELNRLAAAASAPAPAAASKPAVSAVAPALPAVSTALPVSAAPAPAPSTSVKPPPPKPKPAAAPPTPMPEPSFLDDLLENPLLPAGAAGLIALLAGLGFYKVRQRRKEAQLDSSFVESKWRPDSFLGASGGQNVDTNDDNIATGSSMVYSPSQLDAVDDVDPVAEADVYLAYGRDLQAEEILKDALRNNPQRLAIHHKLLEIYTKRRDTKGFEATATLAFNITNGSGSDWEQICEKGLSIDPDNALYRPGGLPEPVLSSAPPAAAMEVSTPTMAPAVEPEPVAELTLPKDSKMDLDLDLDFSLDETAPNTPKPTSPAPDLSALDISLDLTEPPEIAPPVEPAPNLVSLPDPAPAAPAIPSPAVSPEIDNASLFGNLDFSMPLPELDSSKAGDVASQAPNLTATEPTTQAAPAADGDLMSFDLDSLSLDLGEEPTTEAGHLASTAEDPLETKLALAEEFRAIGDDDGARALIEEVIAEASGDMKAKAQRALSKL